jgi:hypothetical protein
MIYGVRCGARRHDITALLLRSSQTIWPRVKKETVMEIVMIGWTFGALILVAQIGEFLFD